MVAKAARGVCWYEKAKKPYPRDEEGLNYRSCQMNANYDGLYEKKRKFQEEGMVKRNPGFSMVKNFYYNHNNQIGYGLLQVFVFLNTGSP